MLVDEWRNGRLGSRKGVNPYVRDKRQRNIPWEISNLTSNLHRPNRRLRTIDDGSQWHDRCCFQAQKFRRAERQCLVHQQCWLLWHVGDVAAEESRPSIVAQFPEVVASGIVYS